MPTEIGHVSIRNLRVETWAGRLALFALWLVGGLGVAFAAPPGGALAVCVAPVVLLAGTASLLSFQQGRSLVGVRRRGAPGSVTVDGDFLEVERLGHTLRIPRADVAAGWTEPGATGLGDEVVLLTRRGIEVRLALRAGRGEGVLHAAGVAADQRAVKIRVPSAYTGQARFAMVASAACLLPLLLLSTAGTGLKIVEVAGHLGTAGIGDLVTLAGSGVVTVVCGLSAWLLLDRLATTTLTIGTDGVVIEHLRSRRVIPRAAMARVQALQGVVLLRRSDGAPVRILSSPAAAAAVAARIQSALQVIQEAPTAPVERLDRRDRPVAEWLDDLRSLARDGTGYREISFDRQALFAVVKDGAASPERRLAAAAALSTRRDPEDRAALRIAADSCADERLRVVLDHAGEAELGPEELEAAVARLSVMR